MNIFIDEHEKLVFALHKHKVSFMRIGGYAVIYYGYERITGGLWISGCSRIMKPA